MVCAIGLADHYSIVSPIDGKPLYGRTAYLNHLKEHNVLPQSELKGESAHQKEQMAKAESKQRSETIRRVVETKLKQ